MKLARWLIGISCAVGIVPADSKSFPNPRSRSRSILNRSGPSFRPTASVAIIPAFAPGNLLLSELNADSVPAHPEIFEKAVRKLRGRQMPPPGNLQPSQKEIDALIGWLESTLDESSKAHLAGRVPSSA